MKILYDYQMFSLQKFGGVTRYFCEIMKNFPPEHQFSLSLLFSENHHLKENRDVIKKMNILPGKNFKGKYYIQKSLVAVNRYYSKRAIAKNDFDIFHPTYYDNYFFDILKKPYVITAHDLILFKFADTFYKSHTGRPKMENAIKKANRVIAISENTRKDLVEILGIHPEKIDVIYHGYNTIPAKKTGVYGKYILFVGRRNLYKNFIPFAKAVSKLLNREKDIKLVCVGAPFDKEEMEVLVRSGILDQSVAVNVDDSFLNGLYAEALAFVFPSLYEGFGMPILEAFANDCPVCLSNTSCFPEIAGNGGVYFDPYDQESISKAVEKVVYDSAFAKEIKLAGRQRLAGFSWKKAAMETVSSYIKTN
ncbi:MAG: glycosyltransferase family 1 protein [Ginsengibacter sp.]